MLTIISRIIHYGFANFWRSGWPSAATVAITVLALLVFAGLIMFNVVTDQAAESIQSKIDVVVYFKSDAPEDEILSVKQSLESLTEVKEVLYVSSDQAKQNFETRRPEFRQAVQELDRNPFLASLEIKANNPEQYQAISQYLEAPNLSKNIDDISYHKNKDVIDRLVSVINNVNRGGFLLTLVLALIAGLVVFNTVQLAIYSNRDEIGIMRAVGASNALVRGPFMVEGIIAGVISATLSLLIAAPLTYFISPYFSAFIPGLNLFQYFYSHLLSLIVYQLIFGILIGTVSSFVAVRRYLRN